ncbi:hypothetical protein ALP75_203718 [Pseudomonas syringae pv. actinidiae]|nr:hypothetical protein ALP75_203718 [Pseudomonas syringae pv. actinidiae]
MLIVLDVKRAALGVEAQGDFSGLQHGAVITAQKRQQQLAFQQRVRGIPLDVEEVCVRAATSPFQQVQPPRVIGAADGHVVGHDVEDQAHAVFAQGRYQAQQGRFAAQLRVDDGRVDHIVAMHGASAGLEQRRRVDVTDAQAGEVGHQWHGVIKGEVFMKLQALGGAQRL